MKKAFLTLGLFLMSIAPTLAYYDDYGYSSKSETSSFSVILAVIIFIFGILQIILFFKVWGMTNDVNKIKEKYLSPAKSYNPTITYFGIKSLNGAEAAKEYLIDEIIKELSACDTQGIYKRKSYENLITGIKDKFSFLLADAGMDFPGMGEYLDAVSPTEYKGLKVGEKVRLEHEKFIYDIISFNPSKDAARIVRNGFYYTYKISELVKVEGSQE